MAGRSDKQFVGLEISGVKINGEIGKGGFGERKFFQVVYNDLPYSAREFNLGVYSYEREKELMRKCQRWANLHHPNIVKFIGLFKRPTHITKPLLVMEKMGNILSLLLKNHPNIPAETKLSISLDVSLGLEYLHGQNPPLVHGHLSVNVILLTTEQRAKISGMEEVQIVTAEKSKTASQKLLMQTDLPTQPSDVFSYGSIALHTITQWLPVTGFIQEKQRHTRSSKNTYQSHFDQVTDDTKHLKDLVLSCLHHDAKERPTISEISGKIKAMAEGKLVSPNSTLKLFSEVSEEKEKISLTGKETKYKNEHTHSSHQIRQPKQQVNKQQQHIQEKEQQKQLVEVLGNQLTLDFDEQKKEMDLLKAENTRIKEQLKEKEQQCHLMMHDNDSLKQENVTLKKDIDMLKQENVSLTQNNDTLKRDNDMLKQENVMLKKEISNLEKSLESKTNELKLVSNQMEQQSNELKEQVTMQELLTKQLEETKQECNQFKHQMQQLQEQIVKGNTQPAQGYGQDNSGNQGGTTGNDSRQDFSGTKQGNNYSGDQNSATENKQEQGNTGSQAEEPISNTSATEDKSSQEDKTAPGVESLPNGKLPPGDQLLPEVKPLPADKPLSELNQMIEGKLPPADEPTPEAKPTPKGRKLPPADEPFVGDQDFGTSDGLGSKHIINDLENKLKVKDEKLELERDPTEQQSVLDNLTGTDVGNDATISQDHEVKHKPGNESTEDKDHMTENQPRQSSIGDQDGTQNNTGGQTNIELNMTGNKPGNYHTESQNTMTGNESQVIIANQSTTTRNEPGQDNTEDQGTTKPGQGNHTGGQDHTAGNQPKNGNAKNKNITTKTELESDKLNGGKKPQEEKPPPGSKPPLVNNEKAKDKQPRESLNYSFSDGLGPKVIGFHNLGNTCFFNSMLQSIHQTPRLHYAMARKNKSYVIPGTEMDYLEVPVTGSVTSQLHNFFSRVSRENWSISPSGLLHSLGIINKRFGRGTQEDSHEVMRLLLSAIREEEIHCIKERIKSRFIGRSRVAPLDGETKLDMKSCLSKASKGVCEVDQLIGTLLVTTTVCHHCCSPLEIEELCLDLSLPMPTNYNQNMYYGWAEPKPSKISKKQDHTKHGNDLMNDDDLPFNKAKFNRYLEACNLRYSQSFQECKTESFDTDLEQCLADFTDLDVLDEYNKFICQQCSTDDKLKITERHVSKQILIHRLPPVLILHMKRFSIGNTVTKDNQHVSFSPVLNMTPFCTTECIKRMADKENKILYGLYAVVVHGGSLHGGHYTANVRRRPLVHEQVQTPKGDSWKYDEGTAYQGDWYYTSDSHVSSRCDFSSVAGSQAYLLFYELLPITN